MEVMLYQVIAPITAVVFSLSLMVFVAVFCCHKAVRPVDHSSSIPLEQIIDTPNREHKYIHQNNEDSQDDQFAKEETKFGGKPHTNSTVKGDSQASIHDQAEPSSTEVHSEKKDSNHTNSVGYPPTSSIRVDPKVKDGQLSAKEELECCAAHAHIHNYRPVDHSSSIPLEQIIDTPNREHKHIHQNNEDSQDDQFAKEETKFGGKPHTNSTVKGDSQASIHDQAEPSSTEVHSEKEDSNHTNSVGCPPISSIRADPKIKDSQLSAKEELECCASEQYRSDIISTLDSGQASILKSHAADQLLTSSILVNTLKVCHEPQDSVDAGAHEDHQYLDTGNHTAADQEEVKSKDVASSIPVPNANYLTSSDIREVRHKIWEARMKWYHIGIELGINVDDLEAIRSGANHHNIADNFTEMLTTWLRQTGSTWEALSKALRSKQVGYPLLADSITSASAGLSAVGYETTVSDQCTSSVRKSEEGFNCGCPTPCRLSDYLNGKCPSSSKLFPFLDVSSLTENERDELEGKLCKETTAIVTEFAIMTERMKKSLVDQDLKPEAIVSSVLGIAPSESSTFPILETLDVEKVTSIYGIIIHLQRNSYISFFNYHIVEYLIEIYGTEDDQAMLKKYITHFHDFCRRSVFEVPHHIHGQPPKNSKQLAIKVIPKNQLSTLSLADAKNVQLKVAEKLGLRNCGSLPLFEISKGCVVLTFALPKVIMEFVKPKLSTLSKIEIGKYLIHILCAPPGKPFATDITSDSVTLQWVKPEYEGTHSLTNYLVYYRSVNSPWERGNVTYTDVSKEHVTVQDLSYKDEVSSFVFKVTAVSKSGTSVESRESDPIQLSTPLSELESRLKLDWKKKSAMPFGISAYPQVAVLKEKVYIGGGNTPTDKERHVVIVYDPLNDTYDKLPPYTHKYFAMAVMGETLVLIGGEQDKKPEFTNQLGVWNGESLEWTHPLPPMSTACKCPSVTTYKNRWLVVIGGYNTNGALSRVEILDISSQLWFNSAPMLAPCYQVSLATIGNMCYLMGGLIDNATYSKRVYEVHIDCLISQSSDTSSTHSLWKTLPDTPGTQATALALNGALLAVGGMGADMYMYQSSSKSWINTGRLRIGRSACACTVLSNGDVFVAGGGEMKVAGDTRTIDQSHDTVQKVDIGTLKQ